MSVSESWVEVVEIVKKGSQFDFCMCPDYKKVIYVTFEEKGMRVCVWRNFGSVMDM